jgi:hypothetical protein
VRLSQKPPYKFKRRSGGHALTPTQSQNESGYSFFGLSLPMTRPIAAPAKKPGGAFTTGFFTGLLIVKGTPTRPSTMSSVPLAPIRFYQTTASPLLV